MVGKGESGQGERFVYLSGIPRAGEGEDQLFADRKGEWWSRPAFSMRAALASRSMGGPSSSAVGRNCRCLCA